MNKLSFQDGVAQWLLECFGPAVAADKTERADRFIEEALELVQAVGYPAERILALLSYVYGRPAGEPHQEVGGAMVTLASFCFAHDIDMDEAAATELARIWTKIEAIRTKQATKPTGSALPVARLDNGQYPHADNEAVDLLIAAAKMKNKLFLARRKGRGGWDDPTECTNADLSRMLREHVEKGDPVDVANFCAFLIARGERILAAQWFPIAVAPKDGTEFIGRCGPNLPSFSCFWDGLRFVHNSYGEGYIAYPVEEWIPMPGSSELNRLATYLKSLISENPEKARLAASREDLLMWFLSELIAVASGTIPLTEIEAIVFQHLAPTEGGAA
ncbi:hypothetical protein [Agrobacterium tumefaciens]|uniref:hypothetical protein n=1 Tax=Agrobacterium tumefaciens TaxID=358 RepID=UPI001BA5CC09|nr:hypothetical protein [Agrobacterium tumefaciens]